MFDPNAVFICAIGFTMVTFLMFIAIPAFINRDRKENWKDRRLKEQHATQGINHDIMRMVDMIILTRANIRVLEKKGYGSMKEVTEAKEALAEVEMLPEIYRTEMVALSEKKPKSHYEDKAAVRIHDNKLEVIFQEALNETVALRGHNEKLENLIGDIESERIFSRRRPHLLGLLDR